MRYHFDIYNGSQLVWDTVGTECVDYDAVRDVAMHALPQIARDSIPRDGPRQAFTVLVRNAANLTIFTATLTFAALWLGEDIPVRDEAAAPDEPAAPKEVETRVFPTVV